MRITYTRRLGQHPAGTTHTLEPHQAHWLIRRGLAHATTDAQAAAQSPKSTSAPDDPMNPDTASLADLKAKAESMGLPTYGTKATLADRIQRHLSKSTPDRKITGESPTDLTVHTRHTPE